MDGDVGGGGLRENDSSVLCVGGGCIFTTLNYPLRFLRPIQQTSGSRKHVTLRAHEKGP